MHDDRNEMLDAPRPRAGVQLDRSLAERRPGAGSRSRRLAATVWGLLSFLSMWLATRYRNTEAAAAAIRHVVHQHPRCIMRQCGVAPVRRLHAGPPVPRRACGLRRAAAGRALVGPVRLRLLCSISDPDGITIGALRQELDEAAAGQSELLVIDVRSPMEIQATGPINCDASLCENVPLEVLFQALAMDDGEWEDELGFEKPSLDRPVSIQLTARFCPAVSRPADRKSVLQPPAGLQLCCRYTQRACDASGERSRLHQH